MKMYQASYFNRLTKERFIVEMVSGLEEAWDESVVGYVCKAMNWNINTFCYDVVVRLMIDGEIVRIDDEINFD